tara:strand:- start:5866 stop:6258 length:393 start_codon:yes stop_codon:yes gene_type:complete
LRKKNIFQIDMKKSFSDLVNEAAKEVQEIDIFQLKHLIESKYNFALVDIREDNEIKTGVIENSIHIGRGVLDRDIEGYISDPTEEIVLYCARGVRSIVGAKTLQDMGYQKVFSLKGGITEWIESGFKLKE